MVKEWYSVRVEKGLCIIGCYFRVVGVVIVEFIFNRCLKGQRCYECVCMYDVCELLSWGKLDFLLYYIFNVFFIGYDLLGLRLVDV